MEILAARITVAVVLLFYLNNLSHDGCINTICPLTNLVVVLSMEQSIPKDVIPHSSLVLGVPLAV